MTRPGIHYMSKKPRVQRIASWYVCLTRIVSEFCMLYWDHTLCLLVLTVRRPGLRGFSLNFARLL